MKRTLALIQMEICAGDKESNVAHARELLHEAAGNADILVLPEMWTIGYNFRKLQEQAGTDGDELYTELAAFAKERNVFLLAGSMPICADGKIYNRSYCFGPQGEIARYDKVHLFSLLAEPKHFAAGDRRVTVNMADIPTGLSICYDLRFPELYRSLALDGARLLFVPAEWPESRLLAWVELNRARAIENQVYVCAVNGVGTYRSNVFAGRSALLDPMGEYIVRGGDAEEILYGEYDSERVREVREHMSVWKDRRLDVYKNVYEN